MMRTVTTIVLACAATFCLGSCSQPTLVREVNNPDQPHRVLIASEGTAYKNAVVNRLVSKMSVGGPYVKVVALGDLTSVDPSAYDVVLVMGSLKGWGLNNKITGYLADSTIKDRVILVTTIDNRRWQHPDLGVDTVTGASIEDQTAELADRLLVKIRSRLNEK